MRWLHCSDFHTGKDRTAQEKLASKMIDHVKTRISEGFIPDLVFITGDIANFGLKREFDEFHNSFLQPLRETLGGSKWSGRILAVPGNHDVDRSQHKDFDRAAHLESGSRFFDPDKHGKIERDILAPRFKAYRKGVRADLSDTWLGNPEGAFAEIIPIEGVSFGVVGINTAWLSKDDHDRLKLTPGVELVKAALERVKDCPVRIVLGHHPLTWMDDEHAHRLRALFGYYRVIYLHGHLHETDGTQEDGAGNPFLSIQSGAAFQARDGEPWRNGLLWGEIDLAAEQVLLSPRYWNPKNYDWPVESGRFPEKRQCPDAKWWAFPLPSNGISPVVVNWCPPDGWEMLTAAQLETRRREVTADEAERFFDGAEPDWGLALCPKIPRRARVNDLAQQIATHGSRERPMVMLLTGPGGEGKSMALRQILTALLEPDNHANILWHVEETRPLLSEALAQLPNGAWVIATDSAGCNRK